MRPAYRIKTDVSGVIGKAVELIQAFLCDDCREHMVGECPPCFKAGEPGVMLWQHAWLPHMAQFHPRFLEIRTNVPEDPKPAPRVRKIGTLRYRIGGK